LVGAADLEWPVRSRALALVTLATVAAMIGAAWRKPGRAERGAVLPQALLGFGCAVGLTCICSPIPPSMRPARVPGRLSLAPADRAGGPFHYLWTHLRRSLIRARFPLLLPASRGWAFW